jgi:hypothetical protein
LHASRSRHLVTRLVDWSRVGNDQRPRIGDLVDGDYIDRKGEKSRSIAPALYEPLAEQ